MKRVMPVLARKYAERFAANWKAQNPEEQEIAGSFVATPGLALDDSLTSLQWLHNMNVLDLTSSVKIPQAGTSSSSCCSESDENSDCESGRSYSDIVESKEPSIDYKNDPTHKPSYSYATLICMAMRETKKTKITLSAIYKWIKENFMYYRVADPSWQNSIRHNLSLNKCFIKVPRRKDEPGKGGFWKIDPAYADMFVDGVFKRRRGVQTQKTSKSSKSKTPAGKMLSKSNHRPHPYDSSQTSTEREGKSSPSYSKTRRSKPGHLTLNGGIKIEPEDVIEEELPPFSGELKGDFSWNSVLPEEDIDTTIKELATAHGIHIDSPPLFDTTQHVTSGLHTPVCLSPPPSSDGNDDHFPDLDLTIHGIGLLPPPDWVPPSPRVLTVEEMNAAFNDMPPSPPFSGEEHPWAEADTLSYSCLDDLFNITDQSHIK